MALFKRKGSKNWYFKFHHNGQRIERSTGFSKKKDARAYMEAFRTKLINGDVGLITKQNVPILEKALESFFKTAHRSLQPKTIDRYKTASKPLIKFFGKKKISHIHHRDIENYIDKRLNQFAHRPGKTLKDGNILKPKPTKKKISPATVNKELQLLKKIIKNLLDREIIYKNPASNISKLKEDNESGRVINREEEELFLNECDDHFKDYVILLLETGMRPNELVSTALRNINLETRSIFVENGKTQSARRFIPLTDRALDIVLRRVEVLNGTHQHLFPGGKKFNHPTKHIVKFNNAHYGALRRSKIDGINRSGTLKTCTLYSMRHTFATRFIEAGGNPLTLAALLGHSNLTQVMVYSHPGDSHKITEIQKIDAYHKKMTEKQSEFVKKAA